MYQVLYRKWRPQTFSDVVGQEHITKTLMGAVESGRVSHAYLFTGTRGTGKTSCAKILAKAVNCEHPVNGNPCNECAACKGIDDGSVVDVVEIDAASNNGVDNIRDLREETNYMPSSVKYRVYIIDEVHMLSTGAFNALLKTLEEPPEHVKFILATTEVQKLPSTILSRCQRFDFKRISADDIAKRLKYVAENENIELTDDGAMLIARVADGGMRDALSLLDRCSSYGKKIDEEVASDATGIAGKQHIYALVDAIIEHNCEEALNILNSLYQNSCDMERLFSELISHFRNMMISLSVPNYKELILTSESEAERIKAQAQKLKLVSVLSCMDVLNDTVAQLKKGVNKRIIAEMTVIRLTSPELDTDTSSLLRRIAELEARLDSGNFAKPINKMPSAVTSQPQIQKITPSPATAVTPETGNAPVKPAVDNENKAKTVSLNSDESNSSAVVKFNKWSDVIDIIQRNDPMISGFLNNSDAFIYENLFLIKPSNTMLEKFITQNEHSQKISDAVRSITGKPYKVQIYDEKAVRTAQVKPAQPSSNDPLEDLIKRAKELNIEITVK